MLGHPETPPSCPPNRAQKVVDGEVGIKVSVQVLPMTGFLVSGPGLIIF